MTDTDLIIREEQTSVSVLEGDSPAARVVFAQATARALAPVITEGHLYADISGKKHVLYEGWTTLGQMLGVFPVTMWSRPLANGYEARVEARTLGGALVGAAEAECTRDEDNWKDRDDYALRSMAQTRAGSKALRMCLGFIVTLAGFDAVPAEEMLGVKSAGRQAKATEKQIKFLRGLLSEFTQQAGGFDKILVLQDEGKLPEAIANLLDLDANGDKMVWHLSDLTAAGASAAIEALK